MDATSPSYNPLSLVCLKHKKSTWYVQVTKPLELQRSNDKQIRRSTGTTDLREAERRKHKITEEIYALFDYEIDRRMPQPKVKFNYVLDDTDPLYEFRPKPEIPRRNATLRLSRIWPRYVDERKWGRQKYRNLVISYVKEFIGVVGDLQVDELEKK